MSHHAAVAAWRASRPRTGSPGGYSPGCQWSQLHPDVTDPDDYRGLSPGGDHQADCPPPGCSLASARLPGGMSASTRAVDPAGPVTVSSARSRSRCSDSGVAERDGRLQPRAVLHLARAGPSPRRPGWPGCPGACARMRAAARSGRPLGTLRRRHLGHGDRLITVLDFHATRLVRTGHGTLLGSRSDPVRTGPCPGAAG